MSLGEKRNKSVMNWEFYLDEGKREFYNKFENKQCQSDFRKTDFTFIRTIGEGAFSRVYLTRLSNYGEYYATKIMDKMKIFKLGETKHIINEKKILQSLNFPFCVHLVHSFKDNSYVYLCLPFIAGGEMFTHLKRLKRFDETLSKFYGAQVVLAFEYLHHCDLIYRDLKPENILIDRDGYLKLTDFGFSKVIKDRTYTVCGTPDYLAPEVLVQKGYGKSVDWWTYGVLLYEMNSGKSPFEAKQMMKIDVTKRYGCRRGGIKEIKEHTWFNDISWLDIFNRQVKAPFVPSVLDDGDTSNFERFKEVRIEVARKDYFSKEFEDF